MFAQLSPPTQTNHGVINSRLIYLLLRDVPIGRDLIWGSCSQKQINNNYIITYHGVIIVYSVSTSISYETTE